MEAFCALLEAGTPATRPRAGAQALTEAMEAGTAPTDWAACSRLAPATALVVERDSILAEVGLFDSLVARKRGGQATNARGSGAHGVYQPTTKAAR